MDFFIKQHSTLPSLKYSTNDLSKGYMISNEMWENSIVTFSLMNKENGNYEIANKEAIIIPDNENFEEEDPTSYFLKYTFTKEDTKKSGTFLGEFKVEFINDYCGTLTIPTENDAINIFIKKSITKID